MQTLASSHDFANSNNTSNLFLGVTQRSWMNGQNGSNFQKNTVKPTQQAVPVLLHQKTAGKRAADKDNEKHTQTGNKSITTPCVGEVAISNGEDSVTMGRTSPPMAQIQTPQLEARTQTLQLEAPTQTPQPEAQISAPHSLNVVHARNQILDPTVIPVQSLAKQILATYQAITRMDTYPGVNRSPDISTLSNEATSKPNVSDSRQDPSAVEPVMPTSAPVASNQQHSVTAPIITSVNSATPVISSPSSRKRTAEVHFIRAQKRPSSGVNLLTQIPTTTQTATPVQIPSLTQTPTPIASPILPGNHLLEHFRKSMQVIEQRRTLSNTERRRLQLIHDACIVNDLSYLFVHQILCIWSMYPNEVAQLGIGPVEITGLNKLDLILGPNGYLGRDIVSVFANFPDQVVQILKYRNLSLTIQTRLFLGALGGYWDNIRQYCSQRSFPPCAQELRIHLLTSSPIMQRSLFSSIHHQIPGNKEIVNDDYHRSAMELFERDQRSFMQQISNSMAFPPISEAENRKFFGAEYMVRRKGFLDLHAAMGAGGAASAVGTTGPTPVATNPVSTIQPRSDMSRNGVASVHFIPAPSAHNHAQLAHQNTQGGPRLLRPIEPSAVLPSQLAVQSSSSPPTPLSIRTFNYPSTMNPASQALLPSHSFQLPQNTRPNTDRIALHQAHLRSPKMHKLDDAGKEGSDVRMYQYPREFALDPQTVDEHSKYIEWKLVLSPQHFKLLALSRTQGSLDNVSPLPPRIVTDGSLLYRLKCVSRGTAVSREIEASEFAAQSIRWPMCCFVSVNEMPDLELRRKSHHGKNLAADLTNFLRVGENVVRASFHWMPDEVQKQFFFAVEVIEVADHAKVLSLIKRITSKESIEAIKTSMKPGTGDEDIVIVDSFVSIDLVDPITASIWHVPVRGKTCLHRECFDLNAFLQSRTSRQKNGPTSPDEWRCPICRKDARPQSLVIDEFLSEVRAALATMNQLDARAIRVMQDGRWEAKMDASETQSKENHSTTRETSSSGLEPKTPGDEKPSMSAFAPVNQSRDGAGEVIVIEIDD